MKQSDIERLANVLRVYAGNENKDIADAANELEHLYRDKERLITYISKLKCSQCGSEVIK